MGKVVVVGSSNTDMVFTTSKIPLPGETVMGSSFDVIPGGKGANQAVAAARAGAEVIFIAKVGKDDFGKKAIEGYQKDGINTFHIFTDEEAPSGVAMILVDETSGQNSIVVAPGANANLSTKEIEQIEREIKDADVLLVQLEIPLDVVQLALKISRENKVLTILNPAPAQPLDDNIYQYIDIITPNESETELLTGIYPDDPQSIMEATSILLAKVNNVIITLGSKGAFYATNKGKNKVMEVQKVKPVDTTAAGDVFNGYLAAVLSEGKTLEEAINLANKAAAISVTRKGTQPSIPFIDELK